MKDSIQFTKLIKQAGLKVTKARVAVLETVTNYPAPMDVQELIVALKKKKISADQATIYRILDTFTENNLIKRIDFGEGKFRYEQAGDHHHHLVCQNCGKIEAVEDCDLEPIEKTIGQKYHFTVSNHALEFFGHCQNCQ